MYPNASRRTPARPWKRAAHLAIDLLALLMPAGAAWLVSLPPPLTLVARFEARLPDDVGSRRLWIRVQPGLEKIEFSPDGKTLAGADDWGRITVWDVETGKVRTILEASDCAPMEIAIAPDNRMLAAITRHPYQNQLGLATLWDIETGKQGASSLVWPDRIARLSEDGSHPRIGLADTARASRKTDFDLGMMTGPAVGTVDIDFDLSVLEACDKAIERSPTDRQLTIMMPWGPRAVSTDGRTYLESPAQNEIEIRDAADGLKGRLKTASGIFLGHEIHARGGLIVAFVYTAHPYPTPAAPSAPPGEIKLFDQNRGRELPSIQGHRWRVRATPDGKFLASMGYQQPSPPRWLARLPDAINGHALRFFGYDKEQVRAHEILVHDVDTAKCVARQTEGIGPINCSTFSPDGNWLATASGMTVSLWKTPGR